MKTVLRKELRDKRQALTQQQQTQKSEAIAQQLTKLSALQSAKKIALYHAVNAEANPSPLQQSLNNKECYLPVLASRETQGLVFAPFNNNSAFKNNQFSIPEPVCSEDELINGEQLDLVIVPLLGFDKHGNRLGMGGGYYDRCFSFKNNAPTTQTKPILVGYAYALQEIEQLISEPWDVKLDYVVTELSLIKC